MRVVQTVLPSILLAVACGDRVLRKESPALAVSERASSAAAPAPVTVQAGFTPASAFWATQKLIRTAELRIQVRDVLTALKITDSIAKSQQTLLADSRTSQDADGKRTAEIVLRAPSSQFAGLLQALHAPHGEAGRDSRGGTRAWTRRRGARTNERRASLLRSADCSLHREADALRTSPFPDKPSHEANRGGTARLDAGPWQFNRRNHLYVRRAHSVASGRSRRCAGRQTSTKAHSAKGVGPKR